MAAQDSDSTQQLALGNGEVSSNGAAGGEQTVQTAQDQQPPPQQPPNAWQVSSNGAAGGEQTVQTAQDQQPPPQQPPNAWQDLHVYISESEHFTDFNNTEALLWGQTDLVYGDWSSGENGDGCYEHYQELDVPESVKQNGSVYVHVYFTKSGFHPDPKRKGQYRRLATAHMSRTPVYREQAQRAEDYGPIEVISHWHPNVTISMVDDHTAWVKGAVPPPLDQYVKFDAVSGDYFPIVYFNDYWNLQKDYFPINETVEKLPLRLVYCPLSLWRWQLYTAQSTKSPWNFLGEDLYEQSDEDQDSVKVALLETNPYLLGVTIVVSIVHSVFEFLAFKNGFITMTPQLFINYKMKSVAHLPWRMLTYKALNTFIDDLFAFVIKMPMMYRIGCLRDAPVLDQQRNSLDSNLRLIYLYQRWIYRVDPTRMNEFGTSGVEPGQATTEQIAGTESEPAAAITDKPDGQKKND
ncbi:UNVERIFIED_CONTAM: hypothetical protein FKN15_008126 [Acipenser sinensis]